ncbi:metal ABC transporter ATP-binding protein [Acetobacterium sp.]|jgi:zinc transport system ATP-binding protein|uniref:metal ABC transporter ATP-binding protein n=1 Tax=Acetobacterium sp. TaxID=1872094 RepID=UPI000CC2645C|nr:ABC transporter ATP-binding protein [Acetobacterium sp.]MDO9492372.1 ABC transporter ATP-binding protein [Acetobacterium sp.]PKM74848.1 MAG: ABC transporter [Firmicutes bacterium HGW-Firmicutes-17]
MKLISCVGVTIGYDGQRAVNNVSFDLEQGDYLCVVGENGSGKSTLVKGLLGLIKPQEGSITFDGIAPNEIGYLPQQTVIQRDFPASVTEVVISGCLNRRGLLPFYSRLEKARAADKMKQLNITDIKKKSYRDLSGGQQQRVLLARALCATEKLLLLDEPVSGLDPVMTADLYQLVAKLNQTQGITVMMVSHDLESAIKYGNKILHMKTATAFFGSTEDYLKTEMCQRMMGVQKHD